MLLISALFHGLRSRVENVSSMDSDWKLGRSVSRISRPLQRILHGAPNHLLEHQGHETIRHEMNEGEDAGTRRM